MVIIREGNGKDNGIIIFIETPGHNTKTYKKGKKKGNLLEYK